MNTMTQFTKPESDRRNHFRAAAIICSAVCFLPVEGSAGKPGPVNYPYNLHQIALPPGSISCEAKNLNNPGEVVGQANLSNNEWTACFWDLNGTPILLPTLSGAQIRRASASTLSDRGLISGASITYLGTAVSYMDNFRATFWEKSAAYEARDWNDFLPGESSLQLTDGFLSDDGEYIVFRAAHKVERTSWTLIAQVEYQDGLVQNLNPLAELPDTRVHSVSYDGQGVVRVLGSTTGASRQYFLWKSDHGVVDIKLAAFSESPEALLGSVNKFGQIANTRSYDGYNSSALLWNEEDLWDVNRAFNLGSFGGTAAYSANVNDHGQVVGRATTGGRVQKEKAFLFANGVMKDLNALAPVGKLTLHVATRINNQGKILAVSQTSSINNPNVYFLLTPAP